MTKRIKQFLALAVFIWFGSNVVYAQLAKEVKSVSITVSDLDQSIKFFNDVLSFKTISIDTCLLYTSPSPRDLSTSRMPSSA